MPFSVKPVTLILLLTVSAIRFGKEKKTMIIFYHIYIEMFPFYLASEKNWSQAEKLN